MGYQIHRSLAERVWALVRAQHGVIARWQLLELGVHPQAIKHRIAKGRLHRTPWRGVYVVGRPELTQEGRWMAAVLACGREAYLSHRSGLLWRVLRELRRGHGLPGLIHVSLNADVVRRPPGIRVHRRPSLTAADLTTHNGIRVTTPVRTLIDLATVLEPDRLEAAVNEACGHLDLIDPESLRAELDRRAGQRGVPVLRELLDHLPPHRLRARAALPSDRQTGRPASDYEIRYEDGRVEAVLVDLVGRLRSTAEAS